MNSGQVSRRGFFQQAAAAPAATASAIGGELRLPAKAWIIVALGWDHDDEICYPEGQYPQSKLYYDRAAAEAECDRLCRELYAEMPPQDFDPDFLGYDCDPESATWEDLLDGGFPTPYFVLELEA